MNQLKLNSLAFAALGLGVLLGSQLDRNGSFLNAHINWSSSAVAGALVVIAVGLRLASVWIDRNAGSADRTTNTR